MGTERTAKARQRMIRNTLIEASKRGLKVYRKQLEAQIALEGSTLRHARECVQIFVDAGEFLEEKIEGQKILFYNPERLPQGELI